MSHTQSRILLFTLLGSILVSCPTLVMGIQSEIVWFSTSNTDPGTAPAGGVNTITFNTLGSQTLFVWVTDGTPVTPSVVYPAGFPAGIPPTSAFFSYNMDVTGSSAGAISLTAGSISNPNIFNAGGTSFNADVDWSGAVGDAPFSPGTEFVRRWIAASNFTLAANPGNVTASSITGLDASSLPVAIDSAGVANAIMTNIHTGLATPANDSFAGAQPGYNAARHAFLLGQVSFNTNSFNTDGSTVLSVDSGFFGIGTGNSVFNGSTWVGVTTDLSSHFTMGHANIDIVPEPATWLLLACGSVGLLGFSRRLRVNR
jgi:hypothetical protein